ncbi:MAG: diguanylate cyclase [Oscillospiraceae bacterium]
MIKFLRKQRIVIVSVVLAIASIVILLAVFNQNIENNVEGEMQSYLEEIRDNATFVLNIEIKQFIGYLDNEARTLSLLGNLSDQQLLDELKNFPRGDFMPRSLIMTVDGKVYSSFDGSIRQYNPEEYSAALERKKGVIAQPRFSQSLQKNIIAISSPLYLNGEYFGILIGNYDIADFEKLFSSNFLDGNCTICITTSDGHLISQSGIDISPKLGENIFDLYGKDEVRFRSGSPDEIRGDLKNGKSGCKTYETDGITYYISYTPTGINDWYISAISNEETLNEHANSIQAFASSLVLGVVTVMITLLIVMIISSTDEMRAQHKFLKKMASTDSLTKVFNKAATEREIDIFLKAEPDGHHALLMIDIDGFKRINDALGHVKGDEVLEEFGSNLRGAFRDEDIIGRVGGDEFVVFIKNYKNLGLLASKAEKICDLLRNKTIVSEETGKSVRTSASVGIALSPDDGHCFDELYHNADVALYAAKETGKNRYSFFSKAEDGKR